MLAIMKKQSPTPFRPPDDIRELLDLAARITGRTKSSIIIEALRKELPEIEKLYAPDIERGIEERKSALEQFRKLVRSGNGKRKPGDKT